MHGWARKGFVELDASDVAIKALNKTISDYKDTYDADRSHSEF